MSVCILRGWLSGIKPTNESCSSCYKSQNAYKYTQNQWKPRCPTPIIFLWLCPWISPSIPGKRADNICWTMRVSCGLWYPNYPNGLQTKSPECSTFHITPSCFRTVAVFSHNWPIQSQRNLFNGSHLRLLAFPLEATIDWWPAHLLAAYVENHYRWRRLSIG